MVRIIYGSRDYLLDHVAAMRAGVTVRSASDRANLRALERELDALAKRHQALSRWRVAVFVLLYASVLSNLALPALTILVEKFTLIANLIGVGILSAAALYLTWRIGQLWSRMTVVGAHIIALYEKHNSGVYDVRKERGFLGAIAAPIGSAVRRATRKRR